MKLTSYPKNAKKENYKKNIFGSKWKRVRTKLEFANLCLKYSVIDEFYINTLLFLEKTFWLKFPFVTNITV